jgi:GNAT superfamily N-acetyltransferase
MSSSMDAPPTLPAGYTLRTGYPSVPTYRALRVIGNLTPTTEVQATGAIAGSWHGVYITYTPNSDAPAVPVDPVFAAPAGGEGDVAGMGRIFGDGGWYFVVADIVVHPAHQRRGLGDAIVKALLAEVRTRAPPNAYVTLGADPPGVKLYERNGFINEAAKNITGMGLRT